MSDRPPEDHAVRLENVEVENYSSTLKDKSRPPSQGGNRRAWHRHALTIGGEVYSCLAPWAGKLVYNGETVSFDWDWDTSRTYRNIALPTLVARTASGTDIRRGERDAKTWRTAETRLPARRSDWKD
jgi:hypothetical protein